MFRIKSIQMKIGLIAGLFLTVTTVVLVVYGLSATRSTQTYVSENVAKLVDKQTQNSLLFLSGQQAGIIQSALQINFDTARAMARTFEVLRDGSDRGLTQKNGLRAVINHELQRVLEDNPSFLGTYTAWEPNIVDGNDTAFAGKTSDGYDATGRLIAYWNRDTSGKIARQALVDYENAALNDNGVPKGGWYLGPRSTHKESIIAPLPYIIQGQQDWLATMSVPVLLDGKFYGIAGTDLRLGFLQELAKKVSASLYEGRSDVLIITDMGLVVANSRDASIIGKSGSSLFQKDWDSTLSTIKGAKATITLSAGYIQTFSPVELGRTEKTWSVLIRVPSEVVMAEAKNLDQSLGSQARLTITMQIIVGVTVLIASLILLWIFTGKLVKPLQRASAYANKVAEGDFSEHLSIEQDDEVGIMINSLNAMVSKLSSVLADIKSSAVKVGSGSSELAKSSQVLSQGAANQASSIEQISASMEEMTSNIKQNAENAQTTEKIAIKSAQDAEEGGSAVNKGVEAMKLIASKTLIIEEIARSTNMLALNASIEAARAGEYGKGFAVVASEVGKLAERSQKEASEISKLSADSVTIAEQAGQTIQRIIPDIKKTAELVQEISAASSEQNSGAEQINRAIMQLDQVVQQNASTAEETAGTAEQLSGQAEQMNTAISFFRLSDYENSRPTATASAAADPKESGEIPQKIITAGKRPAVRQLAKKESSGIQLVLDEERPKSSRDDLDNDFQEL